MYAFSGEIFTNEDERDEVDADDKHSTFIGQGKELSLVP
jgi:hypothetical protein